MRPFTAEQFTPTEWSSAADKAKFANHFVRFVESGFKATLFYDWFYTRLNGTFGHIAHYNRRGFYDTWFSGTAERLNFLRHTERDRSWQYGDPAFTYSDVEKVLVAWVRESGLVEKYRAALSAETEASERAQLERLKAKYEPKGAA
jgi:hypothetical protein